MMYGYPTANHLLVVAHHHNLPVNPFPLVNGYVVLVPSIQDPRVRYSPEHAKT